MFTPEPTSTGQAAKRHKPYHTIDALDANGYMNCLHDLLGDTGFTTLYSQEAATFNQACGEPSNGGEAALQNTTWRKYWHAVCKYRASNMRKEERMEDLLDENDELRRDLAKVERLFVAEQDKTDQLSASLNKLLQRMVAITDAFDAGISYLVRSWQVPAKLT